MGKTPTTKSPRANKANKPVFIGLDKAGQPPAFEYARQASSSIHNQGLFASKDIPKDEYIIQLLGERISKKESNRRGCDQHDKSLTENVGSVYIFKLTDKHDIDCNYEWNLARLTNHSCNPNAETQNVDGEIWLVALRDIAEGEELTIDYGYAVEHWEDHPCRCGSETCVGYIVRKEDWKRLKKLVKNRKSETA